MGSLIAPQLNSLHHHSTTLTSFARLKETTWFSGKAFGGERFITIGNINASAQKSFCLS